MVVHYTSVHFNRTSRELILTLTNNEEKVVQETFYKHVLYTKPQEVRELIVEFCKKINFQIADQLIIALAGDVGLDDKMHLDELFTKVTINHNYSFFLATAFSTKEPMDVHQLYDLIPDEFKIPPSVTFSPSYGGKASAIAHALAHRIKMTESQQVI